ncbi:hypothetical protein HY251_01435 [bacterium]|nr:hypothetical protein [bacterium]
MSDYKKKLASQKVSFRFDGTPLSEVVAFFQDATGLNMTISPRVAADEKKVTLRLKDVALENALALVMDQVGVRRVFRNETLLIVPRD